MALPTTSILLVRSSCPFLVCSNTVSILVTTPLSDATKLVMLTDKPVVEANNSLVSSKLASGDLNRGDLDLSSSPRSVGVFWVSPGGGCWLSWSSCLSPSPSLPATPVGIGGFSVMGRSPVSSRAEASAFAAMNLATLLSNAWCTRFDRPGPKLYSLGIFCSR